MTRKWTLSALEFVALYESMREDVLPEPFVFTAATVDYEEYVRQKADARAGVRRAHGSELDELVEIVARPDLRVVVGGWNPADFDAGEGRVRVLGVRRGDVGFVLTQLPGRTAWDSGGYEVTECDAVGLAAAIVDAFPEAQAGRHGRIVLADEERTLAGHVDHSYGRSGVLDTGEDEFDQARRFSAAPLTRTGGIRIEQGISRFGPRGRVVRTLRWRDVRDDGRYVIAGERPPVASGVDGKQLTAAINAEIAVVVRAIKDERR
ncbi:ESX secretion-associated protein EspG [Nocardia farcinica]|uniref:ESX secretion-associated protein EspG n=1 Tax=Nocardia farcinica TaxID=37329 RepID=UPI002458184D|nr:ESX secretion-associated protein EspG [Nocardia farcinica]